MFADMAEDGKLCCICFNLTDYQEVYPCKCEVINIEIDVEIVTLNI